MVTNVILVNLAQIVSWYSLVLPLFPEWRGDWFVSEPGWQAVVCCLSWTKDLHSVKHYEARQNKTYYPQSFQLDDSN